MLVNVVHVTDARLSGICILCLYSPLVLISCAPDDTDGNNDADTGFAPAIAYNSSACEDAIAFPLIPIDADAYVHMRGRFSNLDLSGSTDTEPCGDYAFDRASEMMLEAILSVGYLKEEFRGFHMDRTMFTGSVTQPGGCYSLNVYADRTVCEIPLFSLDDEGVSGSWLADGTLDYVNGNGGGFVDYQHPVTTCSNTLWDRESCGGIFAENGEYLYYIDQKNRLFYKAIQALCEPYLTYYTMPLCDDFLPSAIETLCGVDFCMPTN